jgi:hypothetical protein
LGFDPSNEVVLPPVQIRDSIAFEDDWTVGDARLHSTCNATFRRLCPGDGDMVILKFAPRSRSVKIAESCFEGSVTLRAIGIPRLVEILPTACFSCARIEAVTFESDWQVATIGCRCFEGCMLLTSVNIPCRVTNLEAKCFSGDQIRQMTFGHEWKLA